MESSSSFNSFSDKSGDDGKSIFDTEAIHTPRTSENSTSGFSSFSPSRPISRTADITPPKSSTKATQTEITAVSVFLSLKSNFISFLISTAAFLSCSQRDCFTRSKYTCPKRRIFPSRHAYMVSSVSTLSAVTRASDKVSKSVRFALFHVFSLI